jgi:transcriptional regulator with XRE-family HTH domain
MLTGISESAICRYESGERRVHIGVLVKLAAALGVRPGALFAPPKPPKLKA